MQPSSKGRFAILVAPLLAVGIVTFGPSAGAARLVAIHNLPEGAMCLWPEERATQTEESRLEELQGRQLAMLRQGVTPRALFAAFQEPEGRAGRGQGRGQRQPPAPALREIARQPAPRVLGDTFPTFTAVGVNTQTNEVIIQDNNLWSTWIFNRLENTPPAAPASKPKRIIQGEETHIQFNNGVYVDPRNGDIYSVESDTGDRMVVFSHDAGGNIAPKRLLNTPHRAYSIAVDEVREELYMTIENPAEIVVYRKTAQGDEAPLRRIAGPRTRLEAPHGIAIDEKNQLLFVNHWGQAADFQNPGTGRFNDPGINVYPLNASGDVAPLRVIEGNRTQLNWPGNMALDRESGDLYVANDMGHSVLVFTGMAFVRGNVPPTRVIKGDRTALSYPTGVAVDAKNQELWVSNLGSASAVAFPLKANGNVAPLRVVRAGPPGHKSLTFGRTAAVAYDTNRHEILVPN
jgi:6-phosphogluconolactonase (cycloisomerase 2 family)